MPTHPYAGQAIAWMLTYLLHSTLLLGLAAVASKPLSRWSVAAEEMVWKLALVGALLTASLQVAAGWEPLTGQWRLADLGSAAPAAAVEAAPLPAFAAALPAPSPRPVAAPRATLPAPPPSAARPILSAAGLLLGAWALGASLLLAAFGRSYLRLRRHLRGRPRVVGGGLHAQLRILAAGAGIADSVRLSCSWRAPVPLALGPWTPEICVPPRALAALSDEQQEGMLAHELAHLARRDPLWLLLGQAIACALFFQPLNWMARRRLREISEMLSDEWAVARTGRPLSLAGCLAEVAGWSMGARALPAPGMADRPSSLGRRIRRLLDESRRPESPARRAWLAAVMGVLVIAVAAAAPAVSSGRPAAPALAAQAAQAGKPAPPAAKIDVNDATDVPSGRAAAEEDRAREARAGRAAEWSGEDPEDAAEAEAGEPVADMDEIGDLGDQVNESVAAALAAADGQLAALSAQREMTAEQREKLARDMAKMSQDLQTKLNPRLEELSRQIAERSSRMVPSPEMQKLIQEMSQLARQMRPSEEELAQLKALTDREVSRHGADGKLTPEEREQIRREARELADRMKPTEEQRRKMEELRAQMKAAGSRLGEQFRAENRAEIEKLRREIREEVDREMRAMRTEMRREIDERRAIERQERKERRERRDDAKRRHDRDGDEGDGGSL